MATNNFTCPPQTASGAGTFSDNLVGFQLVAGGGLTQGNFEFTTGITEKVNRTFTTGTFSNPINFDNICISSNKKISKHFFSPFFKYFKIFTKLKIFNASLYEISLIFELSQIWLF